METRRPASIIVGIDGSATSARALQWATSLAAHEKAGVHAVMAWNYPTAAMLPVVGIPAAPAAAMEATARAGLDQIVDGTPTAVDVTTRSITMGRPRAVLVERSEDADLLVVGRTGSGRITRLVVGSTTGHCVRYAASAVAVISDSVALEPTVIVAVDGSESSIQALAWVLNLAGCSEIHAVYSHDEWELDELSFDDDMRQQLRERADEILEVAVSKACEIADTDDARVVREVRAGDPRTTIVDQGGADQLLVLGAQGHSGVARWILGSLADYATNHAPGSLVIWR